MVTFLWCVVALTLVLAGAAWMKARQLSRLCADLSTSYWQLRYEHGQLASRLHRIELQTGMASLPDEPAAPEPGRTSFVPLSSLKKTS